MNTLLSSERYLRPLTPVELGELAGLIRPITHWFDPVFETIATTAHVVRNLVQLLRALAHIDIEAHADGSVAVHHFTGSHVLLRADGNIDSYAQRNLHQRSGEALLFNCDEWFDRMTVPERLAWIAEQMKRVDPEWRS